MEKLLHYVWKHRLFPSHQLCIADGRPVEVLDPGLHNQHQGPDFFNAKVKIDGTVWVGNVELHVKSSDWYKHGHEADERYNNVVLHVAQTLDEEVYTQSGQPLPQLQLDVPERVRQNYQELLEEETYPPCYRVIPHVSEIIAHSWMSALMVERLEEKTRRIEQILHDCTGNWERAFFRTLARNFGFGTNAEAFDLWAQHIPPQTIEKHRDNLLQVEAMFLGQAGLLSDDLVPEEKRDDYFIQLQREYKFLAHKFSLTPMDVRQWRFLRMRPQNFPHIRLSQLAMLYHRQQCNLSLLLEVRSREDIHRLFSASVTPYWETHYTFGEESTAHAKRLQTASLDLLLINTAAPLLFAYGRSHFAEDKCELAFELLESTPPEHNFITRSWAKAGIRAENAGDSQSLIQLRRNYCDRKDCLRCRFGCEYLKHHGEGK